MPWRKSWVDPASVDSPEELRTVLERRAYEVWISEIMLQQTRVAVVIDYWNRWMARWPTIHDLAAASADDVLAAWKGLGYYSRATRIHEAAKHVVSHPKMKGLLPEDVKTLEAEVPGVGRYTAGAISAIVFGNADPLVDGNVLRVLSRQLGILGNVKTDKATIDTLWAAADALVKDVAAGADGIESIGAPPKSNRPGRWGQALMELGSTVCTPKPNCSSCPISSTCRVYNEGQALATKSAKKNAVVDIEDACTLCSPFENAETEGADEEPQKENKKPESAKQTTLSAFFTRPTNGRAAAAPKPNAKEVAARDEAIAEYARKFPLKVVKKPVREEETLVCAVRRGDGRYLLHRRPDKGLLAGLWEFPSRILEEGEGKTMSQRTQLVKSHVAGLDGVGGLGGKIKHLGELGSVPWLFSHLKLVMHVHLLTIEGGDDAEDQVENLKDAERSPSRWSGDVDQESMGTGMNKCWLMVKETEGSVAS
jgi:A/G-specific adenine glycosylase